MYEPLASLPPVRVLSADPPWAFDDKKPGGRQGAATHYNTEDPCWIERFPLPKFDKNAILLLWRVSSQVEEAYRVCRTWGFVPKSEIVWIKTNAKDTADADAIDELDPSEANMGLGHYTRGAHETCILATRGRFKVANKAIRSVFRAPIGEHSEKPDAFFAIIEKLVGPDVCADTPLVELFGRVARPGWHVFGNEVELPNGSKVPYAFLDRRLDLDVGQVLPTPDPFVEAPSITAPDAVLAGATTLDAEQQAHLARAVAEQILPQTLVETDPAEAWIKLQYKAPAGWFDVKPENLSALAYALEARGVAIALPALAKLTVFQRSVAQSWIDQPGTDRPDFLDRWAKAEPVEGCIACARGVPYTEETAFKHTGQGDVCRVASSSPAVEPEKKKGRGRPKKETAEPAKTNGHANGHATNGATPQPNGALKGRRDERPGEAGSETRSPWACAEQLSDARREELPADEQWIDA